MSEFRIVCDYPHPVGAVWRVMTDPALVPLWTTTGRGGRPEGFTPTVGTRFRFVAKPTPGWRGIVDCEVLDVDAPRLLRYSWLGDPNGPVTLVTYQLEARAAHTRFTWEHTGFTGLGGLVMCRLLRRIRRTMLTTAVPAVLDRVDHIDDHGNPRPNLSADTQPPRPPPGTEPGLY
jgi:uncharacterized protein YndB with AHSA1/START domain